MFQVSEHNQIIEKLYKQEKINISENYNIKQLFARLTK